MRDFGDYVEFDEMIGKVIARIRGGHESSEELIFETAEGEQFIFYHRQDCCESVGIDDICGDLQSMIGQKVLRASEVHSMNDPGPKSENHGSYTWTFYKFATINGWVDIRWYGTSNGYYSEAVRFLHVTPEKRD